VTAGGREVCAPYRAPRRECGRSSKPATSYRRAHVGPVAPPKGSANEPVPWLPRVESLELRPSQRKAPPVLRERQPLRGGASAMDLDLSQRDSLISRRAAARQMTDGCPDSPLAYRIECLLEGGGLGFGGLFLTRHA
jgi:hypothetical protein